jgi:hypothetical protein
MTVDKEPISVWEIQAKKARGRFFVHSACVFLICCLLTFWVFPRFISMTASLAKETNQTLPGHVHLMLDLAGWFKVLWVFIAIGLGTLCFMVWRGYFDNFLPVMNILMLLAGLAAVGLALYVFYLPAMTMINQVR